MNFTAPSTRTLWCLTLSVAVPTLAMGAEQPVDFNRDIRPILSNNCFKCHGPDEAQRESDLRLDNRQSALAQIDDHFTIVPGDPDGSELLKRVTSEEDRMPPPDSGRKLTVREVELLRRWIAAGANYARHWSYESLQRPARPQVKRQEWPLSELDYFVLARLESAGLSPAPSADRYTLIRRLALDLRGLPPTLQEVDAFVNDKRPDAYERLVDRLLDSPAYGERWTAMWLDLARYADSAGYANDPPRTIWLYRDWVIRAFNSNMRFDQFTLEQLAGDMLPNATQDQLIATAFHRNTLTNSEGGTSDEEFRNVAIVDRVNTTMQVWMGTTINCAQCHNHKYDPISQKEFFRLFAVFNNSTDSDRADEAPVLSVLSETQTEQKQQLETDLKTLEKQLRPTDEQLQSEIAKWASDYRLPKWSVLSAPTSKPESRVELQADGWLTLKKTDAPRRIGFVIPDNLGKVTALRLETVASAQGELPADNGDARQLAANLSKLGLEISTGPSDSQPRSGRYVRVELPGKNRFLHMAEVQVFRGTQNLAREGKATQSSTAFDGPPELANDGNTDGNYTNKSVSHTAGEDSPWWEVDLGTLQPIDRVVVWNRTDGSVHTRLDGFVVSILNAERKTVWSQTIAKAPQRELAIAADGLSNVSIARVSEVTSGQGNAGRRTLVMQTQTPVDGGRLIVKLPATGKQLGQVQRVRLSVTQQSGAVYALPGKLRETLTAAAKLRTADQRKQLTDFYRTIYAPPKVLTDRIAQVKKQIAGLKPTTVPVMRELSSDKLRPTHIQIRGNFLAKGEQVTSAVPATWHKLPTDAAADRLGVARWLVDSRNPLTPRVIANRYWEQLFGIGLVRTSEEFGAQGELPSHPLLLDWLGAELVSNQWNLKAFLKSIVMSATYRQSSTETPELLARDPFNRLLSRGPRFRLSAEMIRDQALAIGGLLSSKLYGPSVRPPRPKLGLKAAFGGSTDWDTSPGTDRYRRGIYTSWRRSLPYPSMATFDAPSRNVCTIRRIRTNTPLQALVTLNDPVYVESAQALARRILSEGGGSVESRIVFAFRTCLARPPLPAEIARIKRLYEDGRTRYAADGEAAKQLATVPLGAAPENMNVTDLAAWTLLSNVLLNLDETLAKR